MKKIGIATDSHSGISPEEAAKLGVMVLPMPFYIENECFYENISLTKEDFFSHLNSGKKLTTSQPSPEAVMEFWREGLKEYEKIVYIPMSSGLSGSCSTAKMLASEEEFDGKIIVTDNGRVSTLLHRSVLDALEMVDEGCSAEQIRLNLEAARADMGIYVAVETLEHLKRGGRVTPTTVALSAVLNIKPILKFDVGVLETYKKCRGMKKARREMLEAMKKDMEEKFHDSYENGEIYLLAASSADEETTESWLEEIRAFFPGMEILCDKLSMGLSCHIGEGGLGIGCSCRPARKPGK